MRPVRRHPNWAFAERVLAAVLPGSTCYLRDCLAGISADCWQPFDVENRNVDAVEEDLLSRCGELTGPLIVVPDTSFAPDQGPYFVDASQLAHLVRTFHTEVREYFTSGDVIIVAPTSGTVIVVADDGLIATVRGRPVLSLAATWPGEGERPDRLTEADWRTVFAGVLEQEGSLTEMLALVGEQHDPDVRRFAVGVLGRMFGFSSRQRLDLHRWAVRGGPPNGRGGDGGPGRGAGSGRTGPSPGCAAGR